MNANDHPRREDIELYAVGGIDAVEFADIERHFAHCEKCSASLAKEAALEDAFGRLARDLEACLHCGGVMDGDRCAACRTPKRPGGYDIIELISDVGGVRFYRGRAANGTPVTIKEISFASAPSMQALSGFLKEGQLLRELSHPLIPRYVANFELGGEDDKRLYLVHEEIEGDTLEDRLEVHRFTPRQLLAIAKDVLEALVYLHGRTPGIYHRDIRPGNLVRRRDGRTMLANFGSARDLSVSSHGSIVGVFGYVPPKQLVGLVDQTSDLYALGATLIHLISRRPPWEVASPMDALSRVVVPASVREFLEGLTAPEAKDRFASAEEALQNLPRDEKPSRQRKPHRDSRRGLRIALLVNAILFVAVAALGVVAFSKDEPPPPPPPKKLEPPVESLSSVLMRKRQLAGGTREARPATWRVSYGPYAPRIGGDILEVGSTMVWVGGKFPLYVDTPTGPYVAVEEFDARVTLIWTGLGWRPGPVLTDTPQYTDKRAYAISSHRFAVVHVSDDKRMLGVDICDIRASRCRHSNPPNQRRFHTAVTLHQGSMLFVLGIDTWAFSPRDGRWTKLQKWWRRPPDNAVLLGDGRVLFVHLERFNATSTRFDPKTNQWTRGVLMDVHGPTGGTELLALPWGDAMLFPGCVIEQSGLESQCPAPTFAYYFDSQKNRWLQTGPYAVPRLRGRAAADPEGHIVLVGGVTASGEAVDTAERFDVDTNGWTEIGSDPSYVGVDHGLVFRDGAVGTVGGRMPGAKREQLPPGIRFDPNDLDGTAAELGKCVENTACRIALSVVEFRRGRPKAARKHLSVVAKTQQYPELSELLERLDQLPEFELLERPAPKRDGYPTW